VHLGLPILLGTHSRSLDHLVGHLSSDAVFDCHLVIIFYSTFSLTFLCSKLFHVRSVTQGDVIRADAKDIPRIFQVGAEFSYSIHRL